MNQIESEDHVTIYSDNSNYSKSKSIWSVPSKPLIEPLIDRAIGAASVIQRDKASEEESQTRIIASLVPDEVIYNPTNFEHRSLEGCLLYGDVSGFTDLSERYNKTGVGGSSKLTQVLNAYMGAMVQEIIAHAGDVLKFSGDSFLAIWKINENVSLRDVVREAIDCALVIQKDYGSHKTEVGVVCRVKLSIAAGQMRFGLIGDLRAGHYVLVGQPVLDLRASGVNMTAGDIIVSPGAWNHVNVNEYQYLECDDGYHIRVTGLGANWKNYQRNIMVPEQITNSENKDNGSLDSASENSLKILNTENFQVRPAITYACKNKLKDHLKKFILAPVMNGINRREPLEYLTEIRDVAILFTNIVISHLLSPDQILDLSSEIYLIINKVVGPHKGCVNKLSVFDKDLMILVIFGLRGLKDEMESRKALACGATIFKTISLMQSIISVGIGVTTGKTYCGIFGHSLRREYTVISLLVNKAARLMTNYPHKVSCDRNTFLHSKLESSNFILQPFKALKGIKKPGPVYEYKEVIRQTHSFAGNLDLNPLLGRDDLIELYQKMLKNIQDGKSEYGCLVINSKPMQGKTRLLKEFLILSMDQKVINFRFNSGDPNNPYLGIRLILLKALDCDETSRRSEIEKRLKTILSKPEIADFLCCLNKVFNIDFANSTVYIRLTSKERDVLLKKMLKYLCINCFRSFQVVAIDDIEYMDEESWLLFEIMLPLGNPFLVFTKGAKQPICARGKAFLSKKKVKLIELKGIDKIYLGGLACQFLEVEAIPPELEILLQSKSYGCPGWIEGYLTSMIQDGALVKGSISRKKAHEAGLVMPPLHMLVRLSSSDKILWSRMMEEEEKSKIAPFWRIFVDTCRDSYTNVVVRGKIESSLKNSELIPVCKVTSHLNVDEVEADLTLDTIMLKTFDSLSAFEQRLMKCASVLGDDFQRDMLEYMMGKVKIRETALAVKRLFEIGVIGCARGDFRDGTNQLLFEKRFLDPLESNDVVCECEGIFTSEKCKDLPRYASCGFMRFKSRAFRATAYNLLIDIQKKEYHTKAIRYLLKETRKCKACGNGYFPGLLEMKKPDEHLKIQKTKVDRSRRTSLKSEDAISLLATVMGSEKSFDISSKSYTVGAHGVPSTTDMDLDTFDPSLTDIQQPHSSRFGLKILRKLRNTPTLAKTYSSVDFSFCTCNLILTSVYSAIIAHCRGADHIEMLVQAMLERIYICIELRNIPQAIRHIYDCLSLIESMTNAVKGEEWVLDIQRGKFFSLLGYTHLQLGEYEEAHEMLRLAVRLFGVPLKQSRAGQCWTKFKDRLWRIFRLYLYPDYDCSVVEGEEAEYADNVCECLTFLCNYYILSNSWKDADITSWWALVYGLMSQSDFVKLCYAYSNIIKVNQRVGRPKCAEALELLALRNCRKQRSIDNSFQLKAVGHMYNSVFYVRVCRSDLEKALEIGYVVWKMGRSTHSSMLLLDLFPVLVQAVFFRKMVIEAGEILKELNYYVAEDWDNSGRTWFYALCIGLQLETGYTVATFQQADIYYRTEGQGLTLRDPEGKSRFFVVMWLWCIRMENWEAAHFWMKLALKFKLRPGEENFANAFTALYLLEGMLLYLTWKVDKKNIKAVLEAYGQIDELMKRLYKVGKVMVVILPRLWHLKAYYCLIKHNEYQAFRKLKKAEELAIKHGNLLEGDWIKHSQLAWCNSLPPGQVDFWKDHAEMEVVYYKNAIDFNGRRLFTLPTPIYI